MKNSKFLKVLTVFAFASLSTTSSANEEDSNRQSSPQDPSYQSTNTDSGDSQVACFPYPDCLEEGEKKLESPSILELILLSTQPKEEADKSD